MKKTHLTENTFIEHIYTVLALGESDALCDKSGKPIYICTAKLKSAD